MNQSCPVTKFYTHPVDSYKDFFIFLYKEGYVFQKIIQLIIVASYTFIFLKILLPVMYMLIFKFQTMVDIH
jgi:hypothetical protein